MSSAPISSADTLDDKTYEMPKHGFAIHSKFDLESRSSDEMTFVLRESEEKQNRPYRASRES